MTAAEIDEVILVGGKTRMPKVIESVKQFFGREPGGYWRSGAAVQGAPS